MLSADKCVPGKRWFKVATNGIANFWGWQKFSEELHLLYWLLQHLLNIYMPLSECCLSSGVRNVKLLATFQIREWFLIFPYSLRPAMARSIYTHHNCCSMQSTHRSHGKQSFWYDHDMHLQNTGLKTFDSVVKRQLGRCLMILGWEIGRRREDKGC